MNITPNTAWANVVGFLSLNTTYIDSPKPSSCLTLTTFCQQLFFLQFHALFWTRRPPGRIILPINSKWNQADFRPVRISPGVHGSRGLEMLPGRVWGSWFQTRESSGRPRVLQRWSSPGTGAIYRLCSIWATGCEVKLWQKTSTNCVSEGEISMAWIQRLWQQWIKKNQRLEERTNSECISYQASNLLLCLHGTFPFHDTPEGNLVRTGFSGEEKAND